MTFDDLKDIPSASKGLDCYSGLYASNALVFEPVNAEQVQRIFAYARAGGRRVTCRAGGHGFDGQALGDDIVISSVRMNSIEVMASQKKVRVGAGATWGAIVAALQGEGLVPRVTVTTEHATAGGTLSGDCLSRFSPAWGKEGEGIESFKLVTPTGNVIEATRPPNRDPSTWTLEQRAYCGAIGGLGYLGLVVEITHCDLLPAGDPGGKIAVSTQVHKFTSFRDLAEDLVPDSMAMRAVADVADPDKRDAIWCGLDTSGTDTQSVLWFTSAFSKDAKGKPMLLHRPRFLLRPPVEWAMRVPWISKRLWPFFLRLYKEGSEYCDELEGFTFFMDGNARAKHIGRGLGFAMRNVQQTFIVPFDDAEGADAGKQRLTEWLEHAHGVLRKRDLTPTMNDVLFLPADFPFALSATYDLPGFAVSYAFETSNERTLERAKETFVELADHLHQQFSGRVYLVKNVFARKQTLQAMYGKHATEFFALKRQLDPDEIVTNDFLQRTLA